MFNLHVIQVSGTLKSDQHFVDNNMVNKFELGCLGPTTNISADAR